MKDFNAKIIRIVDLKKMEIVEVGEAAAESKCNTARFEYPENVHLTIDATEKQCKDLKNAIDFNNGITPQDVKEKIAGLEFISEPSKEEKKPKVKEPETVTEPDFDTFTVRELKLYAGVNNIDIKGLTTKKDIIKQIKQI